jgi:hypothetical protein
MKKAAGASMLLTEILLVVGVMAEADRARTIYGIAFLAPRARW